MLQTRKLGPAHRVLRAAGTGPSYSDARPRLCPVQRPARRPDLRGCSHLQGKREGSVHASGVLWKTLLLLKGTPAAETWLLQPLSGRWAFIVSREREEGREAEGGTPTCCSMHLRIRRLLPVRALMRMDPPPCASGQRFNQPSCPARAHQAFKDKSKAANSDLQSLM